MIVRSNYSPLSIAFAVVLSVVFAVSADAATVTIAWDPSPDQTVIGYQVYVGTTSGSYTETFDVGLATSFSYSPSDASVYYFAVASYSAGPLLGPLSSEVSTSVNLTGGNVNSPGGNDSVSAPNPVNEPANYWSSFWASFAQATQFSLNDREILRWAVIHAAQGKPTVEITVPTPRNSYSTNQPFVTLGGTAIDDGTVTEVTWSTDRRHRGRATGTENWIAGIPLERGVNTITVRARDEQGNVSSRAIVVNLAPSSTQR
jgi:hypothetical protein